MPDPDEPQRQLRLPAARYEDLLDGLHEGIFVIDAGVFTFINAALARMVGPIQRDPVFENHFGRKFRSPKRQFLRQSIHEQPAARAQCADAFAQQVGRCRRQLKLTRRMWCGFACRLKTGAEDDDVAALIEQRAYKLPMPNEYGTLELPAPRLA